MQYIQNGTQHGECPFCKALNEGNVEDSLIVYKGEKAFVMLNRYPYTSGHLMVLPLEHQEDLSELESGTRMEMMDLIHHACQVLSAVYQPEGFNIGLNIGTAAGAGLPKHLHWHIVPRWKGDTNFMTTIGGVRVIPEALQDTCEKVKSSW
jgi:ATP adenylyltransferase